MSDKKRIIIYCDEKEHKEIKSRCKDIKGVTISRACISGAKLFLTDAEKKGKVLSDFDKAKEKLVEVGVSVAKSKDSDLNLAFMKKLKQEAYRASLVYDKVVNDG